MKRDIDLIRKILIAIEDQYKPGDGFIPGVTIDGYDLKTITEHCSLLHQDGLVTSYKAIRGDDTIQDFVVGNLTSAGYNYLEVIRDDEIWKKTKEVAKEKKIPQTVEWFARIAGTFFGSAVKELSGYQ